MDKVIKKIHDNTREHVYNYYKLKYHDRNMILEILTPLTAYIAELRLFRDGNSFIASQNYNRQDQYFFSMLTSKVNNFKIPNILKDNKYLYILFAINYVLAEKNLN